MKQRRCRCATWTQPLGCGHMLRQTCSSTDWLIARSSHGTSAKSLPHNWPTSKRPARVTLTIPRLKSEANELFFLSQFIEKKKLGKRGVALQSKTCHSASSDLIFLFVTYKTSWCKLIAWWSSDTHLYHLVSRDPSSLPSLVTQSLYLKPWSSHCLVKMLADLHSHEPVIVKERSTGGQTAAPIKLLNVCRPVWVWPRVYR